MNTDFTEHSKEKDYQENSHIATFLFAFKVPNCKSRDCLETLYDYQ
jgi:hypothetical protein